MNSIQLRNYWISKYEDKFSEFYSDEKKFIELSLFKNLLKNFDQYLILEAIDLFFTQIKQEKASIMLFASKKYFNRQFKDLIKERDIIFYKRMLPWYSLEDQNKIKKNIQVYENCLFAISLSQEEVDLMKNIIEELKTFSFEQKLFTEELNDD